MSEPPSGELGRKAQPAKLAVDGPNEGTLTFLAGVEVSCIAELGIYQGMTSERLAEYLGGRGTLHLFDFEDVVASVLERLRAAGHENVVGHGNSWRLLDSYNWSLMKLLREHEEPIFDYVFLDGPHTWAIDALAVSLIDRLLRVGGYLDLDDYRWTLERSPTLNPGVWPFTAELYTEEQIAAPQVQLICDLLLRRDPRYEEVVENKIFRKVA